MRLVYVMFLVLFNFRYLASQNPSLSFSFNPTGTDFESIRSAIIDQNNNVYTTGNFSGTVDFEPGPGTTALTAVYTDVYISKLSGSGGLTWVKQIQSLNISNLSISWSIGVDLSGNIYAMGQFMGTIDFDPGPGVFNMTSSMPASYDLFVLKLNSSGDFQWAKQIASFALNQKVGVMPIDGAGNLYVYGCFMGTVDFDPGPGVFNMTASTVSRDPFVLKLSSDGGFIWARQINDPGEGTVLSTKIDASNSIYLTGYFAGVADFDPGPSTTNLDSINGSAYIWKLTNAGDLDWVKQFGAGGFVTSSSDLAFDITGNIYSTGGFQGSADMDPGPGITRLTTAGFGDAFVLKLNPTGSFIWARQLGGPGSDGASGLCLDNSGNIILMGGFDGTADFDPGTGSYQLTSSGSDDIFITMLNPDGNFKYAFQLGNVDFDNSTSINIDSQNALVISGTFFHSIDADPCSGVTTLNALASQDCFLAKYNHPITIQVTISSPTTTVVSGQSVLVTSVATNGGTNPTYEWQDSTAAHSWQTISGATGSILSYSPSQTGDRVKCIMTSNASCALNYTFSSNVIAFTVSPVTSIDPINGNSYGLKYFPNPVKDVLYIDSLRISDRWETAEIISMAGVQLRLVNIESKTRVRIEVETLRPGNYIILLRKKYAITYLKFVKL